MVSLDRTLLVPSERNTPYKVTETDIRSNGPGMQLLLACHERKSARWQSILTCLRELVIHACFNSAIRCLEPDSLQKWVRYLAQQVEYRHNQKEGKNWKISN